jgi:hypothetical protein
MFNAAGLKEIVLAGGVAFRQSSISYIFDCPRCGKRDKLWMYKESGNFKCWVCAEADGFRGACEKALVAIYGGDYQDYAKVLRGGEVPDMGPLQLEFRDDDSESDLFVDDREPVFNGWEWPPTAVDADDPRFAPGRSYLMGRGIGETIIRKYDIRYSPGENRVLFPYVINGELVGWQGRICGPNVLFDTITGRTREIPKALTKIQEGIQGNYVMFAQNLERSPHAVLTEGPITGLKAELCGGNVTTLGKGVTPAQLRWVASKVKRMYLALDPDAGEDIMRSGDFLAGLDIEAFLMRVPQHVTERLAKVGKKADFGDCTPEEVLKAFEDAERWRPGQLALSMGGELLT